MVNRRTKKVRKNKKSKVSGFLNSVKYGFKGAKDALGFKTKSKKIIKIEKKISDMKKMSKENIIRLKKQKNEDRIVKYTKKEKETIDKIQDRKTHLQNKKDMINNLENEIKKHK